MVVSGGPLAWIDVLLQARNEGLEAERDDALHRAQEAEADAGDATRVCRAALEESEARRHRLEELQAQLRVAEAARRRAERERAEMSSRLAAATAELTWDLVRRLLAELEVCHRTHGGEVDGG